MELNSSTNSLNLKSSSQFSQLQCQILSLQNKVDIYRKEIGVLENKIKIYESDSVEKSNKLNEQLVEIGNLESDNQILIDKLNEIQGEMTNRSNETITKYENDTKIYEQELINYIEKIKKLEEENKKMKEELKKKNNENDEYCKDNTYLLSKIKEAEEKCNNMEAENNNNADVLRDQFDNQLNEFTKLVMNEVKILSQYIDTYVGVNYNEKLIKPPNIYTLTNFPKDSLINFDMLRNSIENARKRLNGELRQYEEHIFLLNNDIQHYTNIIEKNIKEITDYKTKITKLKEDNYSLEAEINKLNNNIKEQKTSNTQLQQNYGELENNNNNYYNSLSNVIINELDVLLNDDILTNYEIIIKDTEGIDEKSLDNAKFKFEFLLDKLITVNTALIEDLKQCKKSSSNIEGSHSSINYM